MDWAAWFKFALALFFVLANGFFVAAEFAFVKVRATRLEELASRGGRRAHLALDMSKNLYDYLSATQLGITLASLALGWFGEPAFASIITGPIRSLGIEGEAYTHGIAAVLSFTAITFLHILFGELAPKSLAIQRAEGMVLAVAVPLRIFYVVFFPIMWILNKVAGRVLRLFGLKAGTDHESALGPEELKMVVATSHRVGLLPERTKAILERTFALHERSAKEIMVPRADTAFLSTGLSFEENLAKITESGFTRFPLCEGNNPDRIVGIVHSREALSAARRKEENIRSLARPAIFVPATQTADSLLQLFRRKKLHIAVVVDEYGGTLGVVTLEDALEVLVGEIEDEFDTEAAPWQKLPEGALSVDAGIPATEAAERLGLPLEDNPPASLGGLVINALGRVPEVGDKVALGGYFCEVTEMKKLRVIRIKVTPRPQASPTPPPKLPSI